jgi:hypothetical protein
MPEVRSRSASSTPSPERIPIDEDHPFQAMKTTHSDPSPKVVTFGLEWVVTFPSEQVVTFRLESVVTFERNTHPPGKWYCRDPYSAGPGSQVETRRR